jgi:TatD DNase family protein
VFAAVGIHPNSASDARSAATREAIEQLAAHPRVVAIGETGFDDHWQDETLASQLEAFEWHADLARRLDKPLVLHVRDRQGGSAASHAAASAIRAAGHGLGVLHCFNGDATLYDAALDLGWYVSFAGNLTYKSAVPIREAAAAAPLDKLLVETDSPYLAPIPLRGSPNVPGNVRLTAARLAEVRGAEPAELEPLLDANARRLFRLEPRS